MTFITAQVKAGDYTGAISAAGGLQGRVLWCDAEANIWALDSREKVAELAEKCKEANFNTIVVDVKPLSGVVLYNSKVAPRLTIWNGRPYPQNYDLLQVMVEECRRVGIEVHAAVNVFSEAGANKPEGGSALANPDWQCIKYEVERWAKGASADAYPIDGVNRLPLPGRLGLISDDKSIPKQIPEDYVSVLVDEDGTIASIITGQPEQPIVLPDNGYMLTASGPAGEWLKANAPAGAKLTIEGKPRFIRVGEAADEHRAVFVNPANPDVQAYELAVISEIVKNYDVDGIVLDRMRYPGIYADFSELSKEKFEAWLGQKLERFPEDIFEIDPIPGREIIRGKYFGQWMEWRAKQIHDFVAEVRKSVKTAKPDALIGVYVGSWYEFYYDVGVNWASPEHVPPYDFASPTYKETGYADMVDWMCTGCYYENITKEEARTAGVPEWTSVEAACEESVRVVENETFVYGSLYLLQYARNPEAFKRAIDMSLKTTQGVMLFDLVYLRDYNWWDVLKQVFPTPAKAPHSVPGLLEKIHEVKKLIEEDGKP